MGFSLFAVLQLCYNKLTGSIPTQLGKLKRLSVLALQYNQLTGAIPASLGDLPMLRRLDLSFNYFFGSVPVWLVNAPMLEVLDIQNNSLSGMVPSGNMISLNYMLLFFKYRCFRRIKVVKSSNVIFMALWMKTQI
jgi:hypothetical protein